MAHRYCVPSQFLSKASAINEKTHPENNAKNFFFCQMHFIIGSNKPLKKAKNSTTLIMTYYFMLAIIFFALSKRRVVTNQLSVSKPTLGQKGKNVNKYD